jgi:SAM-dependent methyltransferase
VTADRAERARSFGSVAELYERRRPGYPAALFDDLLAASPGARRALEAGCGTGRATVELARRGLEVVAVEPDAEMAAVARRATRGLTVDLHAGRFEDWEGPAAAFDLVVSAQAWHWVDFETGMGVARRALAPGGVLAVWWNRNGPWEGELRAELDEVYRRHAPELKRDFAETPAFDGGARLDGFDPIEVRSYDWTESYDATSFVEYLLTHSDHILLEPARRSALAAALAEAIERVGGGRLVYPHRTMMLMARREQSGATV